jgi:hypothetical protein
MATRDQVYFEAGRAIEAACLLETELGTSLLALDALETGNYANPDADAYTRLRDAIDSNTLGRSLHAIKRKLKFSDDLEATFSGALAARNFVAHRFFPHHGLRILEPAGCERMLDHLKELHGKLWAAYTVAQHVSESLMVVLNAAVADARKRQT